MKVSQEEDEMHEAKREAKGGEGGGQEERCCIHGLFWQRSNTSTQLHGGIYSAPCLAPVSNHTHSVLSYSSDGG